VSKTPRLRDSNKSSSRRDKYLPNARGPGRDLAAANDFSSTLVETWHQASVDECSRHTYIDSFLHESAHHHLPYPPVHQPYPGDKASDCGTPTPAQGLGRANEAWNFLGSSSVCLVVDMIPPVDRSIWENHSSRAGYNGLGFL
jgi:hypothetical protein